jgi:hypothetical protein
MRVGPSGLMDGIPLLGTLGGVVFLLFIVAYLVIGLWMYLDAERRGASGVAWLIAWFVGNIFALIIWYLVRPRDPQMVRSPQMPQRQNANQ